MALSLTAAAQSRDSVTVKNEIAQLELKISQAEAKIPQLVADTIKLTEDIEQLQAELQADIAKKQPKINQLAKDSTALDWELRYAGQGGGGSTYDKATAGATGTGWRNGLKESSPTIPPTFPDTVKAYIKNVDYIIKIFADMDMEPGNKTELLNLKDTCLKMIPICDSLAFLRSKLNVKTAELSDKISELSAKLVEIATTLDEIVVLRDKLAALNAELEEIRKNAGETGIEQLTMDNGQLKIYPNPAGNQLQITNYELRENAYIEIYSVVGQLVQTSPNPSKRGEHTTPNFLEGEKAPSPLERAGGEVVIDISHLPNGIYFLKIDNKVVKFIKE